MAFAVFAIMSTMIVQLLNTVSVQRRWNNDFSRSVDAQDEHLVINDKLGYKNGDADDGSIDFAFSDGSTLQANYQMKGTNDDGSVDGLAYFVTPELEKATDWGSNDDDDDGDSDDPNNNTGAQTDRVSARITGTKGFEYISINKMVHYQGGLTVTATKWVCQNCGRQYDNQWETWNECGNHPPNQWASCGSYGPLVEMEVTNSLGDDNYIIYAIELCAAAGPNMNNNDAPYANYRLYFYDSNNKPCEIVFANYINEDNIDNASASKSKTRITEATGAIDYNPDYNKNLYTASIIGSNGIRIGTPFKGDKQGEAFTGYYCTRIEVAFKTDPNLTVNSFGTNSNNGVYTANSTIGGVEVGPNIYGAFPKK